MSNSFSVSPVSKYVGNLLALGNSVCGEFAFVVGGVEFPCNKLASCLFSSKVSRLLSSDITNSKIVVNSKDTQGVIKKVIKLIEGDNIEIETKERNIFYEMTTELESEDFTDVVFQQTELTIENCIERLCYFCSRNQTNEKCISFVSSHFSELERNSLLSLSESILSLVLSSKSLKIKSDEWLFELIEEHNTNSNKEKCESSLHLLQYVEIGLLPLQSLSRFISIIEEFSLFSSVWPSMKRVLLHVELSKQRLLEKVIKRIPSNGTVHGLLNHIYSTDRDNIQVLASSSFSNSYDPVIILDGNEGNYFQSNNEPRPSLTVSLLKHRIRMESYVLRSHTSLSLMSWIVEGLSNGVWRVLDSQSKDAGFLGDKTQTLSCQNDQAFDAFRITQTGKSSRNDDYMVIRNFDIFGELIDE